MSSKLMGELVAQINTYEADNFTKVFAYFAVLELALAPANHHKTLKDVLPKTKYRGFWSKDKEFQLTPISEKATLDPIMEALKEPNSFSSFQEIINTLMGCGQLNDIALILREIYRLWDCMSDPVDPSNKEIYGFLCIEQNKPLVTALLKATVGLFDQTENTIQTLGLGAIGAVVGALGATILLSSVIISLSALTAFAALDLVVAGGYFAYQAYQEISTLKKTFLIAGTPVVSNGILLQTNSSSEMLAQTVFTPIVNVLFAQVPPQFEKEAAPLLDQIRSFRV